jgi:hypothetical protein
MTNKLVNVLTFTKYAKHKLKNKLSQPTRRFQPSSAVLILHKLERSASPERCPRAWAKGGLKELFPITAEPIVDLMHPDNTICVSTYKKFEFFQKFSIVSHHFSKIFNRFALFFECFQTFSNVFILPGLPNRCILTL